MFYILILLTIPVLIVALLSIFDPKFKSAFIFHNYFPKDETKQFSLFLVPRISAGLYSTGWFVQRKYGDGIPDPKHPGKFKAPTAQTRSFQIGFEIIWLFWGVTFARIKEEKR